MDEKHMKMCIGFGLGNMSTITLPFAYELRQQGAITIFFTHREGKYKELFDSNEEFTINLLNRNNRLELLENYKLKACNNFKELEIICNQQNKSNYEFKNIIYPIEYINDIQQFSNSSIVCGFSSVGAKSLPIVMRTANKLLKDNAPIVFYLFENLSIEKEKILTENTYSKLKLRNCVLRRTSGGIKVEKNRIFIETALAKEGKIKYEFHRGDTKFTDVVKGISFIPMSQKEISKTENGKYLGTNLMDYIIARYILIKNIKDVFTEYIFENCLEFSDRRIGDFMDEQSKRELTMMLEFMRKHLLTLNYKEADITLIRLNKMSCDTFGRILKVDKIANMNKLHFAQKKSKDIINMYEPNEATKIMRKTLFFENM